MKYNQNNYRRVFGDDPKSLDSLASTESEPSLWHCVERWLERTPGLEEDGFNFPEKFEKAVDAIFARDTEAIQVNSTATEHIVRC